MSHSNKVQLDLNIGLVEITRTFKISYQTDIAIQNKAVIIGVVLCYFVTIVAPTRFNLYSDAMKMIPSSY